MMQIDARARATFQRNNSLGYLITWTREWELNTKLNIQAKNTMN